MEAAELLSARLEAESPAVHACLDLLLQWTAARICDGNTTALLAVLGFARALLIHLASQVGPARPQRAALTDAGVEKCTWRHQHACSGVSSKRVMVCGARHTHCCAQGIQLSDYEAGCLLPCLVERSGHNQARPSSICQAARAVSAATQQVACLPL